MKTYVNTRTPTGAVRLRLMLLAIAAVLLTSAVSSFGAAAEVSHKKDGGEWRMSWWLGGWGKTGGPERLYFWMEFGPWNSVFKEAPGGLFWHDSRSKGTVVIASAGEGEDANTEPHDILYVGVGTMVDSGLWQETEPGSGLFDPSEKMTWQIRATVYDVVTGEEWRLYWHLVLRGEEPKETYTFEPAK
jgi:hypothetical protein